MKKHAFILGFGISGKAAAKVLLHRSFLVTVADKNAEQLKDDPEVIHLIEQGLTLVKDQPEIDLTTFDLFLPSPGISWEHPLSKKAQELKIKVKTEIELGVEELKGRAAIGITGTNGKTTVTNLVTHVLNHAGIKAFAAGNVGEPLSLIVSNEKDPKAVFVIELSSYQLESLSTPFLDAAVILNITPDHLDRYCTMEDYAKAKARIGGCMKENGRLLVQSKVFTDFPHLCFHHKTIPFEGSYLAHAFREPYAHHDLENLTAAFALCKSLGIVFEQFLEALKTFKKPPHRIEWVADCQGIHFYDDSKGTNLDAVTQAVLSLPSDIILIAGGVHKGASYRPWKDDFKNKVKAIITIGQAAPKIEEDLQDTYEIERAESMHEAVSKAFLRAKSGDKILLSPGCSSFDMFKDYAHRGVEFQKAVFSIVANVKRKEPCQ